MKLTDEQIKIINKHTLDVYPEEAVICITASDAIPLKNIADNPCEDFKVNASEFYKLNGIALVHSHPVDLSKPLSPTFRNAYYVDRRVPSAHDMKTQLAMGIPFGIISCDGKEVSPILWFPDLDSPLEGHQYTHGVYDCYRVIRAYHWQNYGIDIGDCPRDYDWYITRPKLYLEEFANFGFEEVQEKDLRPGDVLIIRLIKNYETHAGIYIGDDKFIHHVNDQFSKIDNYSSWRTKVTRYLRYKGK